MKIQIIFSPVYKRAMESLSYEMTCSSKVRSQQASHKWLTEADPKMRNEKNYKISVKKGMSNENLLLSAWFLLILHSNFLFNAPSTGFNW